MFYPQLLVRCVHSPAQLLVYTVKVCQAASAQLRFLLETAAASTAVSMRIFHTITEKQHGNVFAVKTSNDNYLTTKSLTANTRYYRGLFIKTTRVEIFWENAAIFPV